MSKEPSEYPEIGKKPIHHEYATAEEGAPSSNHAYTLDEFIEDPELEKRILREVDMRPVSYTHLTLPTKRIV